MRERSGESVFFAPVPQCDETLRPAATGNWGIRTLLNIRATHQSGWCPAASGGGFRRGLTELLAKVLLHLGAQHCFVVHGMDGLDEMTVTDRTRVRKEGWVVSSYAIDPSEFWPRAARPKELVGGEAPKRTQPLHEGFSVGEKGRSATSCFNAAPALVVGRKAKTLQDGLSWPNGRLIPARRWRNWNS